MNFRELIKMSNIMNLKMVTIKINQEMIHDNSRWNTHNKIGIPVIVITAKTDINNE